mmetsp:Transcript_31474/g.98731  ORF Transcript_31474/g.98731 Transcript_31474/m.98731 type:complete len:465 (-) Transcript_31474:435-1829(-)
MRAHFVEEGREVGGADDAAGEGLKPVLEPLDVVHVQVACGLVQHEHVGIHQLSSAELHLHLPAARVGRNRVLQVGRAVRASGVSKADGLHQLLHGVLGHRILDFVDVVAGVLHPPPAWLVDGEDGEAVVLHSHLFVLNLMLHEDALQFVALGEAFQLLVGDGAHQRGLPALVGSEEAVEAVALQVHLRVPEQRESAIGQREGALVQVDAFVVLVFDLLRGLRGNLHLRLHLVNHDGEGSREADSRRPVVEAAHVGGHGRQGGHVFERDAKSVVVTELVAEGSLEGRPCLVLGHCLDLSAFGCLEEGLQGPLGDAPRLGVGDLLHGARHQRLQQPHDRHNGSRILHDLAHVVHDQAACALHLLRLVVQAPGEHRQHDGEGWRLHILHEDATGQSLDAFVSFVDGLGGLHHCIQEGIEVLVARARTDCRHALNGRGLHLLLDVASQLRNRGHQVHELETNGLGNNG